MYSYEIWLEGDMLHSEEGFDSEDEAQWEAEDWINDKLEDWNDDDYSMDDFEIIIKETFTW